MADTQQQPNQFNTATLVAFVGATFILLDPLLLALGGWIQAHSSIVFPAGYSEQLKQYAAVAIQTWVAYKHTLPGTFVPEDNRSPAEADAIARLEARIRELEAAASIRPAVPNT